MIDEFAKEYLHENLRWVRQSLLFKLEGLWSTTYGARSPGPEPTCSAWSST